ncbi:two-component sensor histidine kinase [Pseudanabaena sp. FACHB-1998]|nr:two-component sensor histidine kinase [Pseudanabaena sp. FACHB-1998]
MAGYSQSQHRQIFYRSRLQLSLIYVGVMGMILMVFGYVAHVAITYSFTRMTDRELEVLGRLVTDRVQDQLKYPEKFNLDNDQTTVHLCFLKQTCVPSAKKSSLESLIKNGYYVRFLSLSGQTIAAIYDDPERFPSNANLSYSYDVLDQQNQPYHLHLLPLKTTAGEPWGYLQAGQSIGQMNSYMVSLHWFMVIGIPLIIILISLAAWYLAGWALRPIQVTYDRMEQFTADAAHELLTPIATSQAILEVALSTEKKLKSVAPEFIKQQQNLEAVARQIKRLKDLTQDLLLLSRLERAATAIVQQRICLNEMVEDVAEELMTSAHITGINLSVNLCNQLVYITGNSQQIYRLLLNLVSNAIQYTPMGGLVSLELRESAYQATIIVKDNGVGIAPEHLPRIFERFYRVNHDRARNSGGSGLGLAISLAITKFHRGKLTVQSTLNEGSEFKVTLPIARLK